ncbi:Maintenance of telomere capping protein 1 [Ceratocystis platani]|uniref:Maintenance of telomere capping protein 1 n=1 Tax=Ceratocystis fimbriata f. sp. platani TaxID=88771 RepID=A0A0F8B2H3_CERFI|nr:Maintenance of telomere capping protein 1 [Ceratocystis platani]
MASKRSSKAPAADNLDDLFEGIDDKPAATKKPLKSKPVSAASKALKDQDILADLESQLSDKPVPSRPHTPRLKDGPSSKPLVRRTTAGTPPPAGDARKSTESYRPSTVASSAASPVLRASDPERDAPPAQQPSSSGGGGWWGLVAAASATATAAIKQAEQAVKEIQQNDEAKKWADQVRGNVGALKGFGDELRHRAMPTFTNIIHTLAPPISSHERLVIHITHDFMGYPSIDPMVHEVFSRVMSQVEGGDLMVVQRGAESRSRTSTHGWRDGPWWRVVDSDRDMGVIRGLVEGTKLCRANAEAFSSEFFTTHGGIEKAKLDATEDLSESNPVRTSNIFLSVQAVCIEAGEELFGASASQDKDKGKAAAESTKPKSPEELIQFAVFIMDPIHEIEFSTLSQTVPAQWITWLEAQATPPKPDAGEDSEDDENDDDDDDDQRSDVPAEISSAPEEIRAILETGGVDPREWVSEWVEEALALALGTVAQRYVAQRMGVGEQDSNAIKGKRRMSEVMQDGAGEVARANLI